MKLITYVLLCLCSVSVVKAMDRDPSLLVCLLGTDDYEQVVRVTEVEFNKKFAVFCSDGLNALESSDVNGREELAAFFEQLGSVLRMGVRQGPDVFLATVAHIERAKKEVLERECKQRELDFSRHELIRYRGRVALQACEGVE